MRMKATIYENQQGRKQKNLDPQGLPRLELWNTGNKIAQNWMNKKRPSKWRGRFEKSKIIEFKNTIWKKLHVLMILQIRQR